MIHCGRVHERSRRYPSDTSDEQWAIIEPLLPPVRTGGRPEKHPRRAIVDAILYVVRTGCAWRQLPADFPPWQTVYWYFNQWEQASVTEKILPAVRDQLRVQEGRNPEPSAGLIDSQSVKGADTVGRDTRGYDAGKKINGRKRFIVTDTLGLLLVVVVLAASRAGPRRRQDGPARHLPAHTGPVRVRRRRLRRTTSLDWATADPAHHPPHRAQARRPAGLRGDPAPVGRRTDPRLAHRAPPPGPRLRTRPRHVRGHDPLGRDQHHDPPHRPRRTRHPAATSHFPAAN